MEEHRRKGDSHGRLTPRRARSNDKLSQPLHTFVKVASANLLQRLCPEQRDTCAGSPFNLGHFWQLPACSKVSDFGVKLQWANWLSRQTFNLEIAGSNPVWSMTLSERSPFDSKTGCYPVGVNVSTFT